MSQFTTLAIVIIPVDYGHFWLLTLNKFNKNVTQKKYFFSFILKEYLLTFEAPAIVKYVQKFLINQDRYSV